MVRKTFRLVAWLNSLSDKESTQLCEVMLGTFRFLGRYHYVYDEHGRLLENAYERVSVLKSMVSTRAGRFYLDLIECRIGKEPGPRENLRRQHPKWNVHSIPMAAKIIDIVGQAQYHDLIGDAEKHSVELSMPSVVYNARFPRLPTQKIPESDGSISHLCDRRGCIRLEHLEATSVADNNARQRCKGITLHLFRGYIIRESPCAHAHGDTIEAQLRTSCMKLRLFEFDDHDLKTMKKLKRSSTLLAPEKQPELKTDRRRNGHRVKYSGAVNKSTNHGAAQSADNSHPVDIKKRQPLKEANSQVANALWVAGEADIPGVNETTNEAQERPRKRLKTSSTVLEPTHRVPEELEKYRRTICEKYMSRQEQEIRSVNQSLCPGITHDAASKRSATTGWKSRERRYDPSAEDVRGTSYSHDRRSTMTNSVKLAVASPIATSNDRRACAQRTKKTSGGRSDSKEFQKFLYAQENFKRAITDIDIKKPPENELSKVVPTTDASRLIREGRLPKLKSQSNECSRAEKSRHDRLLTPPNSQRETKVERDLVLTGGFSEKGTESSRKSSNSREETGTRRTPKDLRRSCSTPHRTHSKKKRYLLTPSSLQD